jgi:hypothetical protein
MLDDLTRSIKESVSDAYISPETTTPKSFFGNIMARFKGRLMFSLIFFLVFGVAAIGIVLMIVFFVLAAL